jgi:hypothetical protein
MLATLQRLKPKPFHSYYCEKIDFMKKALFFRLISLNFGNNFYEVAKKQ